MAEIERVRVGIYDNPPKVFLDDDGSPSGFWPDLTRVVAEREGWEIEWVHGTWTESLDRLADNRIDMMVDVAVTADRRERFAFGGETVQVSWSRIYAAPGADIETIPDLDGRRIGALAGSVNLGGPDGLRSLLDAFAVDAEVVAMPDYLTLFNAIEEGGIDAAVTNREFGQRMESRFDIVPTSILFQPADLRYAFAPGGDTTPALIQQIDNRIAALKNDSESPFYALQERWFGISAARPRQIVPPWLAWTVIALIGAVLLLALGMALVEMRVRARTRQLREQQARLRHHERMLAESQRIAGVGSWRTNLTDGRLEWSEETFRIVGVDPDTFVPSTERFIAHVHPEDRDRVREVEAAAVEGRERHDVSFRVVQPNGSIRHVHERARLQFDDAGNALYLSGTIQDITEETQLNERLQESLDSVTELLDSRKALINSLPAHIALLDQDGTIIDVNDEWRHFGERNAYTGENFGVGLNYLSLCERADGEHSAEAPDVATGLREVLTGEREVFSLEYPCHSPHDFRWFRVTINRLVPGKEGSEHHGVVVMHVDITERKLAEQELNRLAYEDQLTGVLSRNGFTQKLAKEATLQNWSAAGVVVMLDIDGQRDINDSYGYPTGDRLLIEVGRRLREEAGRYGFVGRIGGDEFAVYLLPKREQTLEQRLSTLSDALSRPFTLDSPEIEIATHIGYTTLGSEPREVQELLREAELALFRHRRDPALSWIAYSRELDAEAHQRIEITRELRQAIDAQQFELHFQPKVNLETGDLTGCEALLRWNHPQRGLVPPNIFIPIAEQSQLIGPIGDWTVRHACRLLREWRDSGLDPVRMSVNVSLVQFLVGNFVDKVRAALDEFGVAPHDLALEITESVFERESETLLTQIRDLHEMGVRLSLDDFGTGYSSLLYLQKYPFDEIKIDQGFVLRLLEDSYSRNIVTTVMGLASALRAEVIAEGIETAEVRDALLEMGCRLGQGFHYSMPLNAEDFRRLLSRGAPLPQLDVIET